VTKTDARIVNTQNALREAVLRLASEKPISDVTVAELTRAAGISRVTFYDHYATPFDVLVAVIRVEFDELRRLDAVERASGLPGLEVETRSIARLAEHIVEYRDVYERALLGGTRMSLHYIMSDYFTQAQLDYLAAAQPPAKPEAITHPAAARYVAHGMTGAVEEWLERALVTGEFPVSELAITVTAMRPSWWR
jgi:AcrR family transcriptional regulator